MGDCESRPFASCAPPPPKNPCISSPLGVCLLVYSFFSSCFILVFVRPKTLCFSAVVLSHDQDDCSPHQSDKAPALLRIHTKQRPYSSLLLGPYHPTHPCFSDITVSNQRASPVDHSRQLKGEEGVDRGANPSAGLQPQLLHRHNSFLWPMKRRPHAPYGPRLWS